MEETLAILNLKFPSTLTRSLSTTNAIGNLMSAIRRTTRCVYRWKNGPMIRRWVGVAVLHAQKRFRRLSEAIFNIQRDTPSSGMSSRSGAGA